MSVCQAIRHEDKDLAKDLAKDLIEAFVPVVLETVQKEIQRQQRPRGDVDFVEYMLGAVQTAASRIIKELPEESKETLVQMYSPVP
ncbi:hypothetical protein BG004_001940, partial [Podila humilis]